MSDINDLIIKENNIPEEKKIIQTDNGKTNEKVDEEEEKANSHFNLEQTPIRLGEHIPECTCGRCIIRRKYPSLFVSLPYNKNISSTYNRDYYLKKKFEEGNGGLQLFNRNKDSFFDKGYKKQLPSSLLASGKLAYKPFLVKNPKKSENKISLNIPLIGSSAYSREYPSYGRIAITERNEDRNSIFNNKSFDVPLRGKSNNKESYSPYNELEKKNDDSGDETNKVNKSSILSESRRNYKSHLKFNGEVDWETSNDKLFKSIDLNDKKYYQNNKIISQATQDSPLLKPSSIRIDDLSIYKKDYIKYNNIFPRRRFHIGLSLENKRYQKD